MILVTVDGVNERIRIPASMYKNYEKEIHDALENVVIEQENERSVVFEGVNQLYAKTMGTIVYRKEKQEESTCMFCKERLRCTTEDGSRCTGYKVKESFQKSISQLESDLLKIDETIEIVYAEVGRG